MGCEKDESHWNPFDTKLEAYIKRRALDRPRYLPAYHEPGDVNYSGTHALFRLLPKDGDYPLKKQKLDGSKSKFEEESALDSPSDVDAKIISYDDYIETASDIPDSLDSGRSNSLGSCYDHVFSSPSFQSVSSSRSSSCTRHSETDRIHDVNPGELNLGPKVPEKNVPHITTSELGQSLQSELPLQKYLFNQAPITVGSVVCRVPLTSIDGNQSACNNFGAIKSQSGDNIDRSSHTTSVSTSAFLPDPSSAPEVDGQSTEGDRSSQSRPSSDVSDTGVSVGSSSKKSIYDNELEALIKGDVLRTDPVVAEIFYNSVQGKLEYSSPEYPDRLEGNHEISLLALLELEAFDLVQLSGTATECPASSTGPPSTSRVTQHKPPASAAEQNKISGSGGSHPIKNASTSQDDPNQLVKAASKSNSSQQTKAQLLRCIHNAISPGTFSVNPETLERFRSCSGPGWNSVQHLKEHMKNVHTKEVKNVNPLQCNRCQDTFAIVEDLKSHELNIDCAIRCPDCPDEFFTKAQRQEHQRVHHLEDVADPALRELDDSMWKQIKDNLQIYTDSVKSRKGGSSGDPDPVREKWVLTNIARFENGRSKTKFNSKLELGQWYTIFMTLAPDMKILEHPFYDYGSPRSDYAQERILFIYDTMIDARLLAHGPPPPDFDSQREWWKEALRESLRIAAQTKKVSHLKRKASPTPSNTLGRSPGPGSGPNTAGGLGYSGSVMATPQMTPVMGSSVPNMSILPHNYHPSPQQNALQPQLPQWGLNTNTPDTLTMNTTAMNFQFFQPPNTIADNSGHTFPSPYNFIGQGNQNDFGGNDPYTGWPGPHGGNGNEM